MSYGGQAEIGGRTPQGRGAFGRSEAGKAKHCSLLPGHDAARDPVRPRWSGHQPDLQDS